MVLESQLLSTLSEGDNYYNLCMNSDIIIFIHA